MPNIEPRPIDPTLEPAPQRTLDSNDLMRRVAADLTPVQAYRAGKKITRERTKTAVKLGKIEDETLLAQAQVIARAKVRSTHEQAEHLLHVERLRLIEDAAIAHEGANRAVDLVRDEVTHSLFKDALNGASARYASGVVRRAGS